MAVGDVTTEVVGTTFRYVIEAPRSLRQHPEYEKMVWDECLKAAHAAGHVPVGAILITDEDIATASEEGGAQPVRPQVPPRSALPPDAPLSDRIADYFKRNPGAVAAGFTEATPMGSPMQFFQPPTMRVTAEVEIGASGIEFTNDKLAEIEQEHRQEQALLDGLENLDMDGELRKLLGEG